jgi:hydrogenase expression/formation protein HypC
MCIGIPMRVTRSHGLWADCEARGETQRVDMQIAGAQPPGTWVLVFQGSARRVLSAEEAAQTTAALDALDAALRGQDALDAFFADLVEREPQLPPHLRRSDA